MKTSRLATANVIVSDTPKGEAFSEFKTAGGKTVRVMNADLFRKASTAAGKTLREYVVKQPK